MPRTELIWEGKYDTGGNRVRPFNAALPFQTVETVNEPAGDRRTLFSALETERPWRNRLIWGDKRYVLPSLLAEFAGQVKLAYIDPPFDTGADFSFTAAVPGPPDDEDEGNSFTKLPSVIEQKAYRDTWGRGLDSYLQWFYETVVVLHELLHEEGSLYVHLDYHVCHYAKAVLDEVFGADQFLSEIVWRRTNAREDKGKWPRLHDVIYFYSKSDSPPFKPIQVKGDAAKMPHTLITGLDKKKYQTFELTGSGTREGESGRPWRGFNPTKYGRHWGYAHKQLDEWDAQGLIHWPAEEGFPRRRAKEPFDPEARMVIAGDVWSDIDRINQSAKERVGYPTQKPEALLERIMRASSTEGDLVLDCVVGSGTTAAVAERLGRRWIAADLSRFAIHTTRKRLLATPGVQPFVVQNLGKYERQHWQAGAFDPAAPEPPGQADARQRAYTEFMLGLYHAQPVRGYTWLHGKKGDRLVHVGGVDAPVTKGDVTNLTVEFKRAVGRGKDAPATNGIDVLGWDFAFELHEVAKQLAEAANISLRFKRIPRDVMDRRAVEQGDIHFFEMAALGVRQKVAGTTTSLELTDFVIPPDDVPEDVRQKVKHWSQWIDFWAVDWDHSGDSFHNEWQAFRTRKEPGLPLATKYTYPEPGEYTVMVKVIDILGNDTTKTLRVKVKEAHRNGSQAASARNGEPVRR